MKLALKFSMNFLIVSLLVFSSCAKEGDMGPMGPQGEQGVPGPPGPEGPRGPAGEGGEPQEGSNSDESEAGGMIEGAQGETGTQGEQGPQGERGPQGEPGTQGDPGEDGDDGEDGNANVIDSGWFSAEFSSGIMRIENPVLNSNLVNKSLILVYGLWSDGEEIIYQFPHEIGGEKFSFYLDNEGVGAPFALNLLAQDLNGNPLTEVFRCNAVKYFIVPSNAVTGKNSVDNLKKMSYQEVVEHFGLAY